MSLATLVKPGDTVRLEKIETERDAGLSRKQVAEQLEELAGQLAELQELLYAARQHSFLIILQGMDTSGKDGTVKHVMSGVNPQGCRVEAFKVPTEQGLAHDFLWRVHQVTPSARHDDDLQPLALRGRGGRARAPAGAGIGVGAALRSHQ